MHFNPNEIKTTLKEIDKSKYPELRSISKDAIWHDIGPGGLYLVSMLARELKLEPNAWVLDLGCGAAESSIYLTSHSRDWWANHIARSPLLEVESCQESEDGPRFFEEQALLTEPEGYFGLTAQQARELELRQIEYGRANRPYMTTYQLVARRK